MTRTTRNRMAAALAATVTLIATPAAALEPLAQEKYINDRLVAARVADRIRRECPSIEGRVVYAFMKARELKAYARGKGYSEAEIEAFLDSRADKDRIYAVAETYMAGKGVVAGDADSFCRLGRDEIARNTVTGSLLSAR